MRFIRILALIITLCVIPFFHEAEAETSGRPALNVYFLPSGNEQEDLPQINQRLNELLRNRFEYDVRLVLPRSNSYHQTIQAELTLGRQIDVAFCNNGTYLAQWVENDWLHPLDKLLEQEGSGIRQWIDDPYMYRLNGSIYGVGNNVERGRSFGFEYNLDLAEEYGIDLKDVHTVNDLTDVFAQVDECCPDVFPTVVYPGYYVPLDQLGGNMYGVLMKPEDTVVVNPYDTDDFWNLANLTYEWTQAGYTYDRFQDSNTLLYYMTSGRIFGALCAAKPGFAAQETYFTGHRIGYVELVPYTLYSSAVNRPYCYIIPKSSTDPQAAMRLLSILYNDPEIANLLIYGLEGLHYQKAGETSVRPNPGSRYSGISGYTYCNQYIAFTFDKAPETLWQEMILADATAPRSRGYGFLFDAKDVERQIVQCDIVCEEYIDLVFSGQLNPQELREEFISALNQAGIRDIIAEKQRQFDLFLAGEEFPE